MAPFLDVEASYQTMRLLERHPHLCNLFFKLKSNGVDWETTLAKLQQALAEEPDDTKRQTRHGNAILSPRDVSEAGEGWSDRRIPTGQARHL